MRVVGMSRSGNHAIIDWILSQAGGRTCFLNCAQAKANPFETARPLGEGEPCYRANYHAFDLAAESQGRFTRKDLLLHSYEDTFLGNLCNPAYEKLRDDRVGRSARRVDVLIVRDPFNLFASRLASGVGAVSLRTAGRIWMQHAREFLGRRTYLRGDRVMVSYNEWAANRAYREKLAGQLGLVFHDAAAHQVPATAGGSSFDGTRHDGQAEAMPVFDRWRRFADHPDYRSVITPEMVDLSDRIFGPVADFDPPATRTDAAWRVTASRA